MLSRNFRLQKVGDANWLNKVYNFASIATSIDELIILDVTPYEERNLEAFCDDAAKVTKGCFVPLALGGNIRTESDVRFLMQSGADKIILNTALFEDPDFVLSVVNNYGSQCVIASIDYKKIDSRFVVYTNSGTRMVEDDLKSVLESLARLKLGEFYLNSIDQDGTGQGYCMEVLAEIAAASHMPIIMAGGAGNYTHLKQGLDMPEVDAVATANLFNFVGDGLPSARKKIADEGVMLAQWE